MTHVSRLGRSDYITPRREVNKKRPGPQHFIQCPPGKGSRAPRPSDARVCPGPGGPGPAAWPRPLARGRPGSFRKGEPAPCPSACEGASWPCVCPVRSPWPALRVRGGCRGRRGRSPAAYRRARPQRPGKRGRPPPMRRGGAPKTANILLWGYTPPSRRTARSTYIYARALPGGGQGAASRDPATAAPDTWSATGAAERRGAPAAPGRAAGRPQSPRTATTRPRGQRRRAQQKKPPPCGGGPEIVVGHQGLEPRTNGLRVHCSTN